MTPLPERRKSNVELNALRDKLGVPEHAAAAVDTPPAATKQAPPESPVREVQIVSDGLPERRHSSAELERMRMDHAMQPQVPAEVIDGRVAGRWLLAASYLLALAGGLGGLAMAWFIYRRKPMSSHHAAWITIIAVLVLVFGSLYLIPKTDGP